jgi:hypothetical protein
MPMRPASSVFMKLTKPSPSVPSRFSAGTSTSSKISSAVSDARQPSLSSFFPDRKPASDGSDASWPMPSPRILSRSAVSFVRMNELMPRVPADGSVTAGDDEHLADRRVRDEALAAVEDVVAVLAHRGRARAAASLPASGSVRPKPPSTRPLASSGT